MSALARLVTARRRLVLVVTGLLIVLAGAFGGQVATHLLGGGYQVPSADSTTVANILGPGFHATPANAILVVEAPGGASSPAAMAAGQALTADVAAYPNVQTVSSYWTSHSPALLSRDGNTALILATLSGSDQQVLTRARDFAAHFNGVHGPLTATATGPGVIAAAVTDHVTADLAKAEAIAFPITFVLLVLVFGGLVASLLPLAVGGTAILLTLAVLRVITQYTDVSIYALNLTTGMGLGLGIDYSLFIITRYREELALGLTTVDAVRASLATAGRTVVFSAMTVAVSSAALLVFPLYFLKSFAYAGSIVVIMAALASITVLPALLVVIGPRINSLAVIKRRHIPEGTGFWFSLASRVMRRPILWGGSVLVVLIVAGLPFLSVRFGLPDDRVLPATAPAHVASQTIRDSFASQTQAPLDIVMLGAHPTEAETLAYAQRLSLVADVTSVISPAGTLAHGAVVAPLPAELTAQYTSAAGTRLTVYSSLDPYSAAGRSQVATLRSVPAPAPALVGGASAALVDTEHAIGSRLPYALGIIGLAMLIILFLFTGSVLLPVKAILANLISLSATFGAMVWIFQEGHMSSLVGHPIITGTLDTSMPVLMFCVAFGLSMDYEVFLLSRITECYAETGDTTTAVAVGLQRTGPLISAAAVIVAAVFLTFVTSGVTLIKLLGLGMALAVLIDATLVRGILVPAFMRLAGRWNWWAPAPLRRLHNRFGVSEAPAARAQVLELAT